MASYNASTPRIPTPSSELLLLPNYECRPSRRRNPSATTPLESLQLGSRMTLSTGVDTSPSDCETILAVPINPQGGSTSMTDSTSGWPGVCVSSDYSYEASDSPTAAPAAYTTSCDDLVPYLFEDRSTNFPRLSANYLGLPARLMCPRDYPSEFDMVSLSSLASPTDAFPPSSYLMDAQTSEAHLMVQEQQGLQGGGAQNLSFGSLQPPGPGLMYWQKLRQCRTPASSLSPAPSHLVDFTTNGSSLDSPRSHAFDDGEDQSPFLVEESDCEGNEPYAKLIHRALMSAPGHRMVLKEIYEWFATHTDKNKNPSQKGWQNSIRHNLSMNGAFQKVEQDPPSSDAKKGFVWVLQEQAIREGVTSTTRYRKTGPTKKMARSEAPALQRQASGRKGGQAAKRGKHAKAKRERAAAAAAAAAAAEAVGVTAGESTCASPSSSTPTLLRLDAGREWEAAIGQYERSPASLTVLHHPPTPETLSNEPLESTPALLYFEGNSVAHMQGQEQDQEQQSHQSYQRHQQYEQRQEEDCMRYPEIPQTSAGVANTYGEQPLWCDEVDEQGGFGPPFPRFSLSGSIYEFPEH